MSHHKSIARQERPENTEKLLRERSIRTNRRNKFVECLSSPDVNISARNMGRISIFISDLFQGELRKLAWAGIPGDLRPMAWQLLLVSTAIREL